MCACCVCLCLLLSPAHHPPLPAIGYLIQPEFTQSYDIMALGPYAPIMAFMNSTQLCAAADAVVTMPLHVRTVRELLLVLTLLLVVVVGRCCLLDVSWQ